MHISDAMKIYPQYEYILVFDEVSARFALKYLPAAKVLSLNRNDSEQAYQTFMEHLDDLSEVYESLIDEQSKETFRGYWLGCTSGQLDKIVHSNATHYLINGFIPARGAVVIEAGAFDGGTAAILSHMGYKVYAFEMDKINYSGCVEVAEKNNFVVENLGLGSFNHETTYTHMSIPSASRLNARGTEVTQIVTLDSYVREKNLQSVDFIKLDVEGAELDVLRGATTTIAQFKPILALSAYHKWDDFWTLMNFVKSIRPDYEFAMRQSYESPQEMPKGFGENYAETMIALGLEPDRRNYAECVLFAR